MSRRIVFSSLAALALTVTGLTTTAQAQDGNADCRNLDDPSVTGWTDHEQLTQQLGLMEASSAGRVQVDVIGESHRGREIYAARVGTGGGSY
jgi:hypothetical protein